MPDNTPATNDLSLDDHDALRQIASIWWVPLLRGVMFIVLGGYALLTPGVTLVAYTTLLGVFVLIDGVLALLAGVLGWVELRWWTILRGLIGLAVGLLVLAHPAFVGVIATVTLVLALAVQSIVGGVLEIITAVRERKEIQGEWWLVLGGLLSIVFGGILLSQPILAAATLIRVVGAFGILAGLMLIGGAFRLRSFGSKQTDA